MIEKVNEKEERTMVELEQALERLLGSTTFSLQGENIPLLESMGKICEQDLFSPMEQPPFPMAKADGYAVRIEDIRGADENHPVNLTLLGTVYAGRPSKEILGPNQAIRITEGALVPEGADCIVDALYTNCSNEEEVSIYTSGYYQQNITQPGEHVAKGQYILRKWERIGASQIGLLAGSGILSVPVYAPLRVGVLSTGEEITDPHRPLEQGHIYDANTSMLQTKIESLGMQAVVLHQGVGDDVSATCKVLEELFAQADVVITTGGVSLGKQDLMTQVYETMSITTLFEGIYFWPGGQTCAGKYGRKIILSLSGSPAASMIAFDLLVRPLCAKMSGEKEIGLRGLIASFEGEFQSNESFEMRRFYFAKYDVTKNTVCVPGKALRPGTLLRASECNSFIEIPKGVRSLRNGESVRVILL